MDRTILDVLRTDPDLTTERLVAKALEVIEKALTFLLFLACFCFFYSPMCAQ
jgi:hypothetical protein